jgi:hypothetical protein
MEVAAAIQRIRQAVSEIKKTAPGDALRVAEGAVLFIERLADHWGELCASKDVASGWADRLLDITRMALRPNPGARAYFHGTTACLSALYRAERHAEILDILQAETFWPHKRWAVRALIAMGRKAGRSDSPSPRGARGRAMPTSMRSVRRSCCPPA